MAHFHKNRPLSRRIVMCKSSLNLLNVSNRSSKTVCYLVIVKSLKAHSYSPHLSADSAVDGCVAPQR